MRRNGATTARGVAMTAACALALAGCAAWSQVLGTSGSASSAAESEKAPSPVRLAQDALAAGNLDAAEAALGAALTPPASARKAGGSQTGPLVLSTPSTADLLLLRVELRVRQGRYAEAESDALTAMALVPPTVSPAETAAAPPAATAAQPAATDAGKAAAPKAPVAPAAPPPLHPALDQRSIQLRLAQLYENAARDDWAEQHIARAQDLCAADPELVERRDCERERRALVRIRMARGHYAEAEPLVLAEIADLQSRYGAYDLRLSVALCDVARFYERQGKYDLSGPLFVRSFDLWKTVRDDAFAEHTRALAAGQPSPFDAEFLRPRAGHAPFAAPCGLEDQPGILYKLGKADAAADAIRFEQDLWAGDTEAGTAASAYLEALVASGADPLDIASARHAVAFVAQMKRDGDSAEKELRAVTEAYAAAWPTLELSERRYRGEDYLRALESLIELLRSTQRFPEAITLGERAEEVAAGVIDAYDSVRLDTLLSLAKTFREMRDPERAEAAAAHYLEAVVNARGDHSADYAWALRTISYAYLLRDELDASQRMEMQAKAIWAKQSIVAPEF